MTTIIVQAKDKKDSIKMRTLLKLRNAFARDLIFHVFKLKLLFFFRFLSIKRYTIYKISTQYNSNKIKRYLEIKRSNNHQASEKEKK